MKKFWHGKTMRWGKRLLVLVLIVGGLFYGMLAMAQRSPDALRKGMEDYLSRTTGQRGEVTDLTNVRLVPDALFDMKGIYVRDRKKPETVYLAAKSAQISLPLWRMLGGGGAYHSFAVSGVETASEFFLPQKLTLDFFGISDPDQKSPPQFLADGRYNNLPLLMTMEMQRSLHRDKPLYKMPAQSMLTFKLGETEGEGLLKRGMFDVSLQSARLARDGMEALFTAENLHATPLDVKIQGTLDGAAFNAILTHHGDTIHFTVTPSAPSAEDAKKIKRFVDLVSGDMGLTDAKNIRIDIAPAHPHSEGSEQQ